MDRAIPLSQFRDKSEDRYLTPSHPDLPALTLGPGSTRSPSEPGAVRGSVQAVPALHPSGLLLLFQDRSLNGLDAMEVLRTKAVSRLWDASNPLSRLRDPLATLLHGWAFGQGENLESRIRAAQFVGHLPPTVRRFVSPYPMRQWTVKQASSDGLYLEFGVAGGVCTNQIAQSIRQRGAGTRLYGFDSFTGLP